LTRPSSSRLTSQGHRCSVAVMLAALGVFGTGTAWPDLVVAAAMALLALTGSWSVVRHASTELRLANRTS